MISGIIFQIINEFRPSMILQLFNHSFRKIIEDLVDTLSSTTASAAVIDEVNEIAGSL